MYSYEYDEPVSFNEFYDVILPSSSIPHPNSLS